MSQQAWHDDDGDDEITWVGMQWRMEGYCGRARRATRPTPAPAAATATAGPAPVAELRPVAPVRRSRPSQGRVVRIGPPRAATAAQPVPSQRAA